MPCTLLKHCRILCGGRATEDTQLFISDQGHVLDGSSEDADTIDLEDKIIAPGFIELQTNGMRGFHFTHFTDEVSYSKKVDEVARYLVTQGVTSFYATIPTVSSDAFKRILPLLAPREIPGGATLLGAHAEGPYLHPSRKGAHNSSLFYVPSTSPAEVYGPTAENNHILKLVTIAPELFDSTALVSSLAEKRIRVSVGHSSASYSDGLAAVKAGATCLTHTLNAMAPLHHRDPGLAGLVTAAPSSLASSPYFSIIPDGNHLHPSVATMLFKSSPSKCIIITDSIELAGLPDGTYPGHAQIPFQQTKIGSRVVIEGTETLIGGCASLVECVQNVMQWSGSAAAEVMRCVTGNVASFMGEESLGGLEVGQRADFVVLDDDLQVLQTWIRGEKVWQKQSDLQVTKGA